MNDISVARRLKQAIKTQRRPRAIALRAGGISKHRAILELKSRNSPVRQKSAYRRTRAGGRSRAASANGRRDVIVRDTKYSTEVENRARRIVASSPRHDASSVRGGAADLSASIADDCRMTGRRDQLPSWHQVIAAIARTQCAGGLANRASAVRRAAHPRADR